jgi:hypothetical protein
MANTNKYGLSRTIDADIKREIRQNAGFGCVICGSAIYTYEHIDPTFSEARSHDPKCMTLLCAACHDRVTRGLLSKETVWKATANPKCLETGFSFGPFDIGATFPEIHIGPLVVTNTPTIIKTMDDIILKIEPPEENGGPFRLSASLTNRSGTEILNIDQNQWNTSTSNWDVQVVGSRITINNGAGDVALILQTEPPRIVSLERLDMYHKGVRLHADRAKGLTAITPNGMVFHTTDASADGCQTALQVTEGGIMFGVGGGRVQIGSGTFGSPMR